jgi:hypothetical protein
MGKGSDKSYLLRLPLDRDPDERAPELPREPEDLPEDPRLETRPEEELPVRPDELRPTLRPEEELPVLRPMKALDLVAPPSP